MTWKDAIEHLNSNPKVSQKDLGYYLSEYADKYGVSTDRSRASFLANFAHETDNFNSLEEYASGAAYEGRTDLGNIYPGDGIKFKGRGGLMITGRSNYRAVSEHIFGDDRLEVSPELLERPRYAVLSSLYYWKSHGLTELADKENYKEVVKRINGGYNGLEDRTAKLNQLLTLFEESGIGGSAIGQLILILVIVAISILLLKSGYIG